jgi:AcrR family transcriptional regulator
MPRIIENLREQLLLEAKRQVSELGYHGVTVRSVAGACGVGVGTVYNYFDSKEMLIATLLLEGWKKHLDKMSALPTDEPRERLYGIYRALSDFADENRALFSDNEARRLSSVNFPRRHKMLREQIASFILPISDNGFASEFIAESLICWSSEGRAFGEVYEIIKKIIKNA